MTIAPESPALVTVTIPGVPVRSFLALHDHIDTLTGELALMASRAEFSYGLETTNLFALLEGLDGPFAAVRRTTRDAAWQARRAGADTFTMTFELPARALSAIEVWNGLLDQADYASSRGVLLTMPAPPDLVDFRRWIGAEITKRLTVAS
jgi:hypothetical protein